MLTDTTLDEPVIDTIKRDLLMVRSPPAGIWGDASILGQRHSPLLARRFGRSWERS
jgi:hypothetical protein